MTGGQRNEIYISKCYKDHCYFYLILQLIVGATWVFLLLVNCLLTLLIFSFFLAFVCLWKRSGCYWGISQSRENSTWWVNTAQNKVLIPFSLCIWITLRVCVFHLFWDVYFDDFLLFHFQFSAFTVTEQCFGSSNEPCSSHNPGKLCIHHYFIIKYSSPISSLYLIFCTSQLSILHFLLRFADGIVSIHSSMQGTLFKKFR